MHQVLGPIHFQPHDLDTRTNTRDLAVDYFWDYHGTNERRINVVTRSMVRHQYVVGGGFGIRVTNQSNLVICRSFHSIDYDTVVQHTTKSFLGSRYIPF